MLPLPLCTSRDGGRIGVTKEVRRSNIKMTDIRREDLSRVLAIARERVRRSQVELDGLEAELARRETELVRVQTDLTRARVVELDRSVVELTRQIEEATRQLRGLQDDPS